MDFLHQVFIAQYEAAFRTLSNCLESCPDSVWDGPVANHTFNQSLFHALFFADVYLGEKLDDVKQQAFHQEHAEIFAGYEELEDRKPEASYAKPFLRSYLDHDVDKMRQVVARESATELHAIVDFHWLDISRAEMHVYNIRHLQHHAAQLIMRLRLDTDINTGWQRTGWD